MRRAPLFVLFFVLASVVACSGPQQAEVDTPESFASINTLTKQPGVTIAHKDGWVIVSKMGKGDHVYWFIAPNINSKSPAQYKKMIHIIDAHNRKITTVSDCIAPKQTCVDLAKKFQALSRRYN